MLVVQGKGGNMLGMKGKERSVLGVGRRTMGFEDKGRMD